MKSYTFHFSEALVGQAVWAFWRRVTGWRFLVAVALLMSSAIGMLVLGDRSWVVGLDAAALGLAVAFAVALYVIHYRGSITRFRRMKIPEATFEVGDERFRVTSDVGSSELVWSAVTEIWQFRDFWLLFVSRAQFITLPLADLDSEGRELILSRAKANGAKIR